MMFAIAVKWCRFAYDAAFGNDVSCGKCGANTSLIITQYNDKISVAFGGAAMKENKLADISMDFSVQIVSSLQW